jgi:hypothetical protein
MQTDPIESAALVVARDAGYEGLDREAVVSVLTDLFHRLDSDADLPRITQALAGAYDDGEADAGEAHAAEWDDGDQFLTDAEADADVYRSIGWGTDEDYGDYGGDDYGDW